MKCKGIVALSKGEVRMMDVDITDPKSDEVQVRMAATMISPGTERAHILALPNSNQDFPYVPGVLVSLKRQEVMSPDSPWVTGLHVSPWM